MSQAELARRVRQAAADEGLYTGCDENQIGRWERGVNIPRRDAVKWLAAGLGIPFGDLVALIGRQESNAPALEPIGPDYIDTLHRRTGELVGLEVRTGGSSALPLANRYVAELRNRVANASVASALAPDLWWAGAGLVGTAAWMAHDADDRDAARRLSFEALYLGGLAGDPTVDVRILSNLALFQLYYGQPHEALAIASRMLDGPLTNYQRVIFQTRKARALAALGSNSSEAVRIIEEATSAFLDGPAPTSAEWWWLDPQEMAGHRALTLEAAGQYERAFPIWQQLADAPVAQWQGTTWAGQSYLRYQRLFRAAVEVGDWRTAEQAVERLGPYVGIVHCGRVDRWLIESLRRLKQIDRAPSSLRMSGQQLGAALQV